MKLILRIVFVALLMVGLSACTLELPAAASASAQRYANGSPTASWALNEKQLGAVAAWFDQHKSGWSQSPVTYVPGVYVQVRHANGSQSSINIWPQLVVVNSGGSQYVQRFEASELQNLLSAVGAAGG